MISRAVISRAKAILTRTAVDWSPFLLTERNDISIADLLTSNSATFSSKDKKFFTALGSSNEVLFGNLNCLHQLLWMALVTFLMTTILRAHLLISGAYKNLTDNPPTRYERQTRSSIRNRGKYFLPSVSSFSQHNSICQVTCHSLLRPVCVINTWDDF